MELPKMEKAKIYDIDSICNKMKKEFGSITRGEEEIHGMQLFVLEEVLLKAHLKNPAINSRRAKEAIRICLLKVKGYLNSFQYDFQGIVDEDSLIIADSLSKTFIPFENEELYEAIKDSTNLECLSELKNYFIEPVQCLIRINSSIDFWEKSGGLTGYFNFLSVQILDQIDINSDKVNFAILSP